MTALQRLVLKRIPMYIDDIDSLAWRLQNIVSDANLLIEKLEKERARLCRLSGQLEVSA